MIAKLFWTEIWANCGDVGVYAFVPLFVVPLH